MTQQTPNKTTFFSAVIELRKWFVLILIALVLFFGYQFFSSKASETTIEYDTALIQEQIKNVGKLVVTEGHFSEVLTYKDQKKYLADFISFDKKALVIINADVSVSFDLNKVKYDIDAKNKIVTITSIPEEEIKISPDIKYYDVEQSTFNTFSGEDYNKINTIARVNLAKKIQKSSLKSNAKNRLVSELSKILIVTNSMGWKLQYNGQLVEDNQAMQTQIKL